jgi:hypothetical protein
VRLRDLLPEPIFTRLYVGGKDGALCMAYGGTVPDGCVRVCAKPRWATCFVAALALFAAPPAADWAARRKALRD